MILDTLTFTGLSVVVALALVFLGVCRVRGCGSGGR